MILNNVILKQIKFYYFNLSWNYSFFFQNSISKPKIDADYRLLLSIKMIFLRQIILSQLMNANLKETLW